MQVTELKAEGLKREFKVILAAKEIDQKLSARLEEVGKSVRLPGFRPGKVPSTILKQRFGASVMGEVIEQAVGDSSQQAIMERALRPAMQPKVEITSYEEGADLEYTMEVELLPEIDLPDFSTYSFERRVVDLPEAEVDSALHRIAENNSDSKPLEQERPAASGDVLVIDFVGTIDGEAFPGNTAKSHHLELGSNAFIQGFEDQLVGVKAGESRSVTVRFPDEYVNEKLAGRDAVFQVDVTEIREKIPAAVDDNLAKQAGFDDLDGLRDAVRKQMLDEFAPITRAHLKRAILDKLAETYDFEVPAGMAEVEFNAIWKQVEEAKENDQLDEEDKAKSDDELAAEYRSIAERRVRLGLVISEIGRANNIDVSQDEISQAVLAEARRNPGHEREVMEYFKSNPQALANLRAPVFEDKVIDFIVELAKVEDRVVTPEELMAPSDDGAAEEAGAPATAKAPAKKKTTKKKSAAGKKAAKKASTKSAE